MKAWPLAGLGLLPIPVAINRNRVTFQGWSFRVRISAGTIVVDEHGYGP
jgi:hypothetical protein